ncbi:hypothetical protein Rhopal_001873-T1 [Rhodotorula paludigena]|uniref:Proteophosphoglycan ppg4 n=1 Tax=Rhodotorula paludigena TaxID=86838 RepID=A0AAV5GHS5_9BASI|nr:hypothetical protein Rhopal_001873-T1 [Rhodotorula paludigena]
MASHAHGLHRRSPRPRLSRRACSSSANLWTFPSAGAETGVYEDVTLSWDPECVSVDSSNVDLYLSVVEDSGLVASHVWQNVVYSAGSLETQLKPEWWGAATGAGSVQAQPSWNTPAPAGPLFTISFNGSYPSVTQSASNAEDTGPSVESVSDDKSRSSGPSGGKLAAAILVPLLVVGLAAAAYVLWYKRKKRPEKKRFSAVVDHRMSMISQGTWQPRPSMASRPGSHRPSGSQYTAANRGSYFADPANRLSTYSYAGSAVGVPSPLGGGPRSLPPADMRQPGQGERASRISFAAGEALPPRPSFASNNRPGSHSPNLSRSAGPTFGSGGLLRSTSSSLSLAVTAAEGDYFSRSGTREELASMHSPSSQSLSGLARPSPAFGSGSGNGHKAKASVASSLRNELSGMPALAVVRDGRHAFGGASPADGERSPVPASPSSPSSLLRPKPALHSLSTDSLPPSSMARLFPSSSAHNADPARRSQILSPDEALASYARNTASPSPVPSRGAARGAAKGGFLWSAPKRLLRSFTGGSIASVLGGGAVASKPSADASSAEKSGVEREGAKSPFEDPEEEMDEKARGADEGVHGGLGLSLEGEPALLADGRGRFAGSDSEESLSEKRQTPGTAM